MIHVENLTMQLGAFRIEGVSFDIPHGRYGVLMGRTGCGKTSILEAICGLKPIESGSIVVNDIDITHAKPALRGIGLVPQDGALFSTMTVREHISFAQMIRKRPSDQINARVEELAEMLGISHLLDRSIHGLSGGERQRTALGRALSCDPPILCLDEPLSALDDETRDEMCSLLKDIQYKLQTTFLHITHSREEAHTLADFLFRIEDGKVVRQMTNNEADKASLTGRAAG